MWIRLRFDIRWRDLCSAFFDCFRLQNRTRLFEQAEEAWPCQDDMVTCLSVRSGFDLLLQVLQLPPGSEVLISALTVPDMARIIRQHGLVPVPVDLEPNSWKPSAASLQSRITDRSRLIVLAHLFGDQLDLKPYLRLARKHHLLLVEDCAQAFCGLQYSGDPRADVSMFSFGPIKTCTALGGGILRLRDHQLSNRMRILQSGYPIQSRWSFLKRVCRFGLLKAFSIRAVFSSIAWMWARMGFETDTLVADVARSFPAEQFIKRIRQQPATPLLSLMRRRWKQFDSARLRQREQLGHSMRRKLEPGSSRPKGGTIRETHWVFPILVNDPEVVERELRRRGFDATRRLRLGIIPAPSEHSDWQPRNLQVTLSRLVLLPWYPELPNRQLDRMVEAIRVANSTWPQQTRAASDPKLSTQISRV